MIRVGDDELHFIYWVFIARGEFESYQVTQHAIIVKIF
jgi:hypothetical protein